MRNATQGFRIVALTTSSGPKASTAYLAVHSLGLGGNLAAQLPYRILENALFAGLVHHLRSQMVLNSLALELHKRAT